MITAIRFRFDYTKCLQAIQFLAEHKPGITQYYVLKIMFFADRQHIKDWGRPICGDRYVAMEHGPVPSNTYNILKSDAGEPDEVIDAFRSRVQVMQDQNKLKLFVRDNAPAIDALSDSDKQYLLAALQQYGNKKFGEIRDESHEDIAYEEAWTKPGLNNEMNIALWLDQSQIDYIHSSRGHRFW